MSSGRCQTDIVKHRPTRTLSPVTATTSSQSINQSINESIDESIDESINQTKHMDIALYVANESEAQSIDQNTPTLSQKKKRPSDFIRFC